MSTPKRTRQRPATARPCPETPEMPTASPYAFWVAVDGFPGYVRSADGRLAREIRVRTNKNGTRWARVMRGGRQTVIRL